MKLIQLWNKLKRLSSKQEDSLFTMLQYVSYEQKPTSVRLQMIVAIEKKPKLNAEAPANSIAK